jgi:hypothetical protein
VQKIKVPFMRNSQDKRALSAWIFSYRTFTCHCLHSRCHQQRNPWWALKRGTPYLRRICKAEAKAENADEDGTCQGLRSVPRVAIFILATIDIWTPSNLEYTKYLPT